ncbi:MAG: hypothetical protein JW984_11750 [Deltaproteobacteria bacterium]|uniref:Uncharacterized protein n=1 Tax=Candidatus Zymogenus saltonus TaxID=2844893 RepID=A0A9D8KFK7_9DELT|nr:hypothetical protein [Candidatus Zymogenus saltonus]
MISKEEIREEQKKINRLRTLVDLTISIILQGDLPIERAQRLVEGVKNQAIALFPGKEETFELIYRPRFNRAIMERYGLH